jgi:hypothetical protein
MWKDVDVMAEPTVHVEWPGFGDSLDPADVGDFASEHDDMTLAYELPDGPEHAREPDEPRGLAGMD